MKLRWQLTLVSLVILLLPWMLLEYFKVFNSLLQENQIRALQDTTKAIATSLGHQPLPDSHHDQHSLFAHYLPAAPLVDGYTDEWRSFQIAPRQFTLNDEFKLNLWAGLYQQKLWILLEVADPQPEPHHPGGARLATGDHVVVAAGHRYYVLHTGTSGPTLALYRNFTGDIEHDYRLQAAVQHYPGGYRLELQLPAALASEHFAIAAIDYHQGSPRQLGTLNSLALLAGGADPGILPPPNTGLVSTDLALQQYLNSLARPGLTLTLVDAHQWQRARSTHPRLPLQSPLRRWLTSLGQPPLPLFAPPSGGRYLSAGVETALTGSSHRQWFKHPEGTLAVASVPVYRAGSTVIEDRLAGVLVAEQPLAAWSPLHNRGLNRLLIITAVAAAFLLLTLIGYASWLSWRIGRLSRAARRARLDPKPEALLAHWPHSRIDDELSELSTSYRDLLQQLRGYTDYLKSLAGKLSHELRTPLAVVRSSLDNLGNCTLNEEAHTYTRRAREGSARLSDILSAMTEASRVETSIQQAEKENIHLAALLQDIANAYSETYRRPVRLLTVDPQARHWHTQVAPELIVQMLDKLVDNAHDFATADTPIELILTYLPHADIPACRLEVSNTGPLLPPGREDQIFDSLTTQREDKGQRIHMGLGLFIVNLIAQYHGGTATARNREDSSGVVIEIHLPLPPPAVFAPRR